MTVISEPTSSITRFATSVPCAGGRSQRCAGEDISKLSAVVPRRPDTSSSGRLSDIMQFEKLAAVGCT